MKNKLLLLPLLIPTLCYGQTVPKSELQKDLSQPFNDVGSINIEKLAKQKLHAHKNGCHTTKITEQLYRSASKEQKAVIENAKQKIQLAMQPEKRDKSLVQRMAAMPAQVTIPVVVHVVHNYGPENIGDYQIIDAIDQMNEDFAAYPYAGSVDGFGYLQTDIGVTFKLAKLDPWGNATSGITRTVSSTTYDGTEGPLQSTINWPRDKYLNVWVVNSSDGTGYGSAYANYPATVDNGTGREYWDGIVVSYWAIGRTGSAISTHHKIMSHEAGHWLNLKHVWGDVYNNGDYNSCSTDDGVNDTPNTSGNTGCSSSYTCGTADNTENFMDYGTCTTMFTYGQSDRMRAALASSVSDRNNLWTQANLIATGLATGNVSPVADTNGPYSGSLGQSISFSSQGSNDPGGNITAYYWQFGDGSSSTAANPSHQYSSTGTYTVSLTVTDNDGQTGTATTTATIFNPGSFIGTESESNNTSSTADGPIGPTNIVQGEISSASDDDWFYFDLTAPDTVAIDVNILSSADLDFWVYHESDLSNWVAEAYGNTSLESVQFSANQTGRYYVYVDGWNGETSPYTLSISASNISDGGGTTPNEPPVANTNGPFNALVGETISLSSAGSSDSDGSIVSYYWSFGDGNDSSLANPNHSYTSAGSYTISLTVTDDQGDTNTASTIAEISSDGNTNPPSNMPDVCASQSVQSSGELYDGQAICLGSTNTNWYYIGDVDGYSSIAISTAHGSGNLDIEFSNLGWPDNSNIQGSSYNAGNNECIYLTNMTEYWGYIKVSGNSNGASLVVDFDSASCR